MFEQELAEGRGPERQFVVIGGDGLPVVEAVIEIVCHVAPPSYLAPRAGSSMLPPRVLSVIEANGTRRHKM